MGAQVDHGAAAGLGRVVKMRRKPIARAAVVRVPDSGVGYLTELAAFYKLFGPQQGGPCFMGVRNSEFNTAGSYCISDLFRFLVGKSQNLLCENMFSCLGRRNQVAVVI